MEEPTTVSVPPRLADGRLVCAGCLQPMDGGRGVFDGDDPDLAWHDPSCAAMWAYRVEG